MAEAMSLELELKEKILDLETKLLENHPMMPNLLAIIHSNLAKNPQLIQSLSDDDIATITKGLATYTKAEIITAKAKTRKAPTKVTAADLL